MVCAAPPSFVLSDVDLSDIFVEEELAYKAAAQPYDVVVFYSAVAAPFRRLSSATRTDSLVAWTGL